MILMNHIELLKMYGSVTQGDKEIGENLLTPYICSILTT